MVSEAVSTAVLILVAVVAAAFLGYAIHKYETAPRLEVYGEFVGGYLTQDGAGGIGVIKVVNHREYPLNISRVVADVYYINGTRATLELYPYSTSPDIYILMNGDIVRPRGVTTLAVVFNGEVSFIAVYLTFVDEYGNTYPKTVSIDTGW